MTTTAIDLQDIPPPNIIEVLSFEDEFQIILADYIANNPEMSAPVESEPAYKVLETAAYYAIRFKTKINNAVRAVMLASADQGDLDQCAANNHVYRFPEATVTITGGGGSGATAEAVTVDGVITAITVLTVGAGYTSAPLVTISGVGTGASANAIVLGGVVSSIDVSAGGAGYYVESDASLRRRAQLAFEGITTAGSEGSYKFHSLSADPRILDAGIAGPEEHGQEGRVEVSVLTSQGASGIASADVLANVIAILSKEDIRPLTDEVVVQSITPVAYSLQAELKFYAGADRGVILAMARKAAKEFVAYYHAVGRDVPISGIYAALHQKGVSRVILAQPVAPLGYVAISYKEASYCTSVIDDAITDGGVGE